VVVVVLVAVACERDRKRQSELTRGGGKGWLVRDGFGLVSLACCGTREGKGGPLGFWHGLLRH
jgi:hypothetical protein